MSGEVTALNNINKINKVLKFLHRKNSFLTPVLRRLLSNALMQPHLNYACSTWYQNLTKNIKHRTQNTQNKCMRFFLKLDKLENISHEKFDHWNWLPVTYIDVSIAFKYFNEQYPNYLSNAFDVDTGSSILLRDIFQKLRCRFRKD